MNMYNITVNNTVNIFHSL